MENNIIDEKLIGNENNIVFYTDDEDNINIEVILQNENVWLNVESLTKLFKIDRSGITKHINNIYKDEELEEKGKKTYFVGIGSVIRACMCVASGDFNVAIFPGTKHKNCDIAAAKIIVEEAGGRVTDLFGNEQRYDKDINGAIISNGKVHDEVVNVVKLMTKY